MESGKTFPYLAVVPNRKANLMDQRLRLRASNLDDFCNLVCLSFPGIMQEGLSATSPCPVGSEQQGIVGVGEGTMAKTAGG